MAEDKDLEQKITLTFGTNADEQAKKVDTLVKSTDNVKDAQKKATDSTRDQKDALNELSPALSGTIEGLKATGKALLTLALNPILLFLTAVVAAFALLGKAFLSNETNSNKLSKGLAVISGLFSGLLKVLEPVASFLVNNIVKSFEFAGNAILATSALLQKALKAIGLEGAAAGLKILTQAVKENVEQSNALSDAENRLTIAKRNAQTIQLEFQRQAEKIRQQRDDETNSIGQRVKLNEQLGVVLQKQLQVELGIAKQQKNVSDLRIQQEGESSANLDERAEALNLIADINDRLSGQESEQLANANSLRNEQKALDKEALTAKEAKLEADRQALRDLDESNRERDNELRELDKEKAKEKLQRDQENGLLTLAQLEYFADEQLRIAEAELAQKQAIEDAKFDLASKGVGLLSVIAGKNKTIQKAAIIADNAIAIGKTIISTVEANAKAVAASPTTFGQPFVTLNTIGAGVGIATSIAATAKALSAVGGGGAGASGGTFPATPRGGAAPQVGFQNSQENQIGTTVAGNINEQPPVQAYVVSSEVTTQQALDRRRVNANSF
jgi:hypothetical protein